MAPNIRIRIQNSDMDKQQPAIEIGGCKRYDRGAAPGTVTIIATTSNGMSAPCTVTVHENVDYRIYIAHKLSGEGILNNGEGKMFITPKQN